MRCIALVVLVACAPSIDIHLPPAYAPLADRVAAEQNESIHQIRVMHKGGRYAVLNDGRVVDNLDSLAAAVPGGVTARAVARYDAIEASELRWGIVSGVGLLTGGVGGAFELYDGHPLAALGVAAVGLLVWALCGHHAIASEAELLAQRELAFANYNADLRAQLHLCTRDLKLVDCE